MRDRGSRLDVFAWSAQDNRPRLGIELKLICAAALAVVMIAESGLGRDAPNAAPTLSNPNRLIAQKLTLKGVPNFGRVTPTLYRGGQPTEEGIRNLAKIGIDIVVDLRGSRETERQLVTKLGMQYVALPWRCFHPRDEPLAEFLTLIRENPSKKVFVHCRVGDDRTGMDIAAYRMIEQGWTPEEAKKEMEVFGVTWFHRRICPGLSSYEETFPERFKTRPAFQALRSDERTRDPIP